jgi:hypothetical protein
MDAIITGPLVFGLVYISMLPFDIWFAGGKARTLTQIAVYLTLSRLLQVFTYSVIARSLVS